MYWCGLIVVSPSSMPCFIKNGLIFASLSPLRACDTEQEGNYKSIISLEGEFFSDLILFFKEKNRDNTLSARHNYHPYQIVATDHIFLFFLLLSSCLSIYSAHSFSSYLLITMNSRSFFLYTKHTYILYLLPE